MKATGVWVIVAAAAMLAGCENSELVTCRQDKETLRTKVDSLQKDLDQANAALQRKDGEIARARTQNVEMQTTAMESIMTMLKKEEERSQKLQAAMAEKDTELKGAQERIVASALRISELEKQIETLRSLVRQQGAPPPPDNDEGQ